MRETIERRYTEKIRERERRYTEKIREREREREIYTKKNKRDG